MDRFPVLYFEGTTEERLQAFQEVNERLYYLIPGKNLHVRPGHTTKMYDYLECQVEDNKEEQINIYFKTVEYLPNICRQLDIPYNPERR